MSATLHDHARSINDGFSSVTHHQVAACGELVSTDPDEDEEPEFTRTEQILLGVAILALLLGGAVIGGT